jgi:hypothetical protein
VPGRDELGHVRFFAGFLNSPWLEPVTDHRSPWYRDRLWQSSISLAKLCGDTLYFCLVYKTVVSACPYCPTPCDPTRPRTPDYYIKLGPSYLLHKLFCCVTKIVIDEWPNNSAFCQLALPHGSVTCLEMLAWKRTQTTRKPRFPRRTCASL